MLRVGRVWVENRHDRKRSALYGRKYLTVAPEVGTFGAIKGEVPMLATSTPRFERRHFEWLAAFVADADAPGFPTIDREALAIAFANALQATNPAFDRERFLIAAGVTP